MDPPGSLDRPAVHLAHGGIRILREAPRLTSRTEGEFRTSDICCNERIRDDLARAATFG